MSRSCNLSSEQIELGRLYAWIHQRAEYLRTRQQRETTGTANTLAGGVGPVANTLVNEPEHSEDIPYNFTRHNKNEAKLLSNTAKRDILKQ